MTGIELKNTALLALVFAMRMMGLFMVIPVLSLYVDKIPGATMSLLGVAIGIYGLTQAVCQLPLGAISDYWGRKKVVIAGLVLFGLGSLIAAYAESVEGLILGRAIQGAGAIGSTLLAWVSDVTRSEVRTRAMAIVGISIGLTFVGAIVLGPIVDAYWGLSGIFILTAVMAVVGIVLVMGFVVEVAPVVKPALSVLGGWRHVGGLHGAVFAIHAILTASFLILPMKIELLLGLDQAGMWRFYLPVLAASLVFVLPLLQRADRDAYQTRLPIYALMGIALMVVVMLTAPVGWILIAGAIGFFAAFNFLEASLPALVSRIASAQQKGSALSIYSFAQFLGIFAGGVAGGFALEKLGHKSVSIGCFLLAMLAMLVLQITFRAAHRREKTDFFNQGERKLNHG